MPDRIETGTYAIATAIAGGEVELIGDAGELIGALVPLLERVGTEITETNRGICRPSQRRAADCGRCDDRRRFRLSRPICRRNSWR